MATGFVKRLTATLAELDAARLQGRFAGLDVTPLGQVPLRRPVRVAGEIQRTKVVPRAGAPGVEVVVSDGAGTIRAVFTGRRRIAGLDAGRGVVLDGVAHDERGHPVLLNPAYTLLPR